jgi:hypothetical protein
MPTSNDTNEAKEPAASLASNRPDTAGVTAAGRSGAVRAWSIVFMEHGSYDAGRGSIERIARHPLAATRGDFFSAAIEPSGQPDERRSQAAHISSAK